MNNPEQEIPASKISTFNNTLKNNDNNNKSNIINNSKEKLTNDQNSFDKKEINKSITQEIIDSIKEKDKEDKSKNELKLDYTLEEDNLNLQKDKPNTENNMNLNSILSKTEESEKLDKLKRMKIKQSKNNQLKGKSKSVLSQESSEEKYLHMLEKERQDYIFYEKILTISFSLIIVGCIMVMLLGLVFMMYVNTNNRNNKY